MSLNWSGANFLARAQHADADTAARKALVSTVRRRTAGAVAPAALTRVDLPAFTRAKLTPMVRGLFPEQEQGRVLDVLERLVVFLTPVTIETVRLTTSGRTVWDLAMGNAWKAILRRRSSAAVQRARNAEAER